MWVLWLTCVALLVIALILLIKPLFKTYSDSQLEQDQKLVDRRKELNVELYKQKKVQIEQDFANGLLDEENKIQAQNEIEHSLIQDAKTSNSAELVQLSNAHAKYLAITFLIFIPVFSIIVYLSVMPDNYAQVVAGEAPDTSSMNANQQAPDIGEMVVSLEKKLQAEPNNIQGWNMLGRSYIVLKRYVDAIGAYEKARELSKKSGEVVPDLDINLVEALMQTGEKSYYQKARVILDDLLAANPDNGDALWFMGFLDYEADRKPLAVERWSHLITLLPPTGEQTQIVNTYLNRVISELPEGHPARKNVAPPAQPRVDAQPGGPAPGQQLTGSDEENAFIASMISRVEQRVKDNPQDLKGWQSLGKSYGVLKRYNDSANAYAKAVAIDTHDVALLMNYSDAVMQSGQVDQLDKARIVFAQLVDQNPKNLDALFLSGALARAAGDVENAKLFWNKLLPLLAEGSAAYNGVKASLESL